MPDVMFAKAGAQKRASLRKRSQFGDVCRRFAKRKISILGLAIVLLLVLLALFAGVLAPYDYTAQDLSIAFQLPSAAHWFGTDNLGRDILSRVLYGGRTSLLVAVMGCLISMGVGGVVGSISGYYSGKVDFFIMRILDVLNAIPSILLAVVVSVILGSGIWQTAIAISISGIAPAARLQRANVLTLRRQEFIEAAHAYGLKDRKIIFTHIVPNCLATLIVDFTLRIGGSIFAISSLSFIGLGVQPPTAEWGQMINVGRAYIREFWPLVTFPGLGIVLSMLGFNLFGDGLRDALDPKMKQ